MAYCNGWWPSQWTLWHEIKLSDVCFWYDRRAVWWRGPFVGGRLADAESDLCGDLDLWELVTGSQTRPGLLNINSRRPVMRSVRANCRL